LLSSKSLRLNFLIKLTASMVVLLTFFSLILSTYINYGVETSLRSSMIKQANYLFAKYPDLEKSLQTQSSLLRQTLKIRARIVQLPGASYEPRHFRQIVKGKHTYLEGYFPYNFPQQRYLVLTKDITLQKRLQKQVFHAIVFLNILAMGLIILYAFFLSKMLLSPIRYFSQKLEKMNENILDPLDLEKIPQEFRPLGHSINKLVTRIKSFLLYKKELFVGTAHELKTPLAVIKTRSQVALMKKARSPESLEGVIRENVSTVDDMNRIISAILEFGRAEGAQFERPVELDLMKFLRKKAEEYSLLAEASGKSLHYRLTPPKLHVRIQPLLLTQILQNLIQNALRFTPEGGRVRLFSYLKEDRLILKIRDEGPGIDESVDLFAPFKRSGDSPGAGLGLFLVKSAADALGAEVLLKNRRDGKGAVATLILPLENLRP
jgi:two-component system OmpR family sensor kinase